ncbi:MAG: chromosomal replication initiation protein DnaA [Bradyrhizobiaceae bacterium PARB1]|nr:MAG: chromosomal replication initiation protein DnaA [Bradyrhizobiaceae bacterium PARB1]
MMGVLHDPRAGRTKTQMDVAKALADARARIDAAAAAHVAPPRPAAPVVLPPAAVLSRQDGIGGSPLDPRLTFATFVTGRSNSLAHAAARQVADGLRGDPVMFNPLYIHAGVGLGKTHLLQALTWAVSSTPERKALYLTAEKFIFGFAAALKTKDGFAYKESLRGIDVLVIDDLQFLLGKLHLDLLGAAINAVIDAGRQVILAADRPASELEGLDQRTSSRLAAGLVVEMGKPDREQRRLILLERVAAARAHHPDFDIADSILDYLAEALASNGRDLEAVVNRLLAHSKLNGSAVTMDLAEREARDLVRPQEQRRIRIEDILRATASHFHVSRSDLMSARRTANIVKPRQLAMYLAKTLTLRSLPEIGRRFGGRDHTTVLHAVRKMERIIPTDADLGAAAEKIKNQLQEGI